MESYTTIGNPRRIPQCVLLSRGVVRCGLCEYSCLASNYPSLLCGDVRLGGSLTPCPGIGGAGPENLDTCNSQVGCPFVTLFDAQTALSPREGEILHPQPRSPMLQRASVSSHCKPLQRGSVGRATRRQHRRSRRIRIEQY